jgi:hypothetical protein
MDARRLNGLTSSGGVPLANQANTKFKTRWKLEVQLHECCNVSARQSGKNENPNEVEA